MIIGVHTLLYSTKAEQDRAFFRDVLGMQAVDSGGGWLIFAMPPAEMGIHPSEDGEMSSEMYLMCDSVEQTIAELTAKGVECTPIYEASWGRLTNVTLPSGGTLGIYEPKHPLAISR